MDVKNLTARGFLIGAFIGAGTGRLLGEDLTPMNAFSKKLDNRGLHLAERMMTYPR